MNEIARWTTPSITYKPEAVSMENIDEIFLVVKQSGFELLRKSKAEASESTNGYTWTFEQTETALFSDPVQIQIDYKSGATRYTTLPRMYRITDSAINEVI